MGGIRGWPESEEVSVFVAIRRRTPSCRSASSAKIDIWAEQIELS